jgi:hypothetical protein
MKKIIITSLFSVLTFASHCSMNEAVKQKYFQNALVAIAKECPITVKYELLSIDNVAFSSWDTEQYYTYTIIGAEGNGHDVEDTKFIVTVEGECWGADYPEVTSVEVLGNCQ